MPEPPILLCLPPAGGAASTFRRWEAQLDGIVRVLALEPPGRGTRRSEAPATSMAQFVAAFRGPALAAARRAPQVALIGHSLGALVARELADVLVAAGLPPGLVIACGRNGPSEPNATEPIAGLPEEALLESVVALGGVPPEVRGAPELLALFVAPLRCDLAIAESWRRPRGGTPLRCPIHVLQGEDDPVVTQAQSAAWAAETTGPCVISTHAGGHFFLHEPGLVTATLRPLLGDWAAGRLRSGGARGALA